jgi:hypothetical protein
MEQSRWFPGKNLKTLLPATKTKSRSNQASVVEDQFGRHRLPLAVQNNINSFFCRYIFAFIHRLLRSIDFYIAVDEELVLSVGVIIALHNKVK